ncbi:MAG: hydrolase [Glaciihabitans sp.]|nr:hydrolase [Glaciihabitans sp.]
MTLGEAPFTPRGDVVRWIEIPGTGTPVVYVHGLGCSGPASWIDTALRLGRPAIIVDLPGHGRSDHPRDFDYGLKDHAAAIAAVIGTLNVGAVDVVGHSLGGSVVIVLASDYPELVSSTVLVEPGIDAVVIAAGDIAAADEGDLLTDAGWERLLATEAPYRRADVQLTDPIALRRSAEGIARALNNTVVDLVRSLTVPTTILVGDYRTYRDQDQYPGLGINVEKLDGTGHFLMWDNPELFADAVSRSWARVSS